MVTERNRAERKWRERRKEDNTERFEDDVSSVKERGGVKKLKW